MSFSGEVKEELSQKVSTARHCQIAELAAIMGMCGGVVITSGDRYRVKIQTDSIRSRRRPEFTTFWCRSMKMRSGCSRP